MSIDLARFHQAFFEESFERADAMEQALLHLNAGDQLSALNKVDNSETINDIFRAAHSIKGGAATFGFSAVAEFTHHLETLLDQLRSGVRGVDGDLVDLMLRAADQVRALLVGARDGAAVDVSAVVAIQALLQQALHKPGSKQPAVASSEAPAELIARHTADTTSGWTIHFRPWPELFRSGNDPLRILRDLETLGELDSTLHLAEQAPAFADADAGTCYSSWTLVLHSQASEVEVRERFAWVEDECDLLIEPLAAPVACEPTVDSAPERVAGRVVPITAASAPASSAVPAKPATNNFESSIRVSISKIDGLINLVGELVISQAMLSQYAQTLDPMSSERLLSAVQQIEHTTRRLQESVMSTRMLPIESVFSRFPRMVHDLAGKLGKQVRLQTVGESTELDKSVIERIGDPLTHLVRNCIDHGIEPPADRLAAGKPEQGTITLKAGHQAGQIAIEIIDDGRGLNRDKLINKAHANGIVVADNAPDAEVWNLIFAPGFSTAAEVTDVSGRGVGMDVVKRNIVSLGGHVEIQSTEGHGMKVRIRLPLTLAIVDGMSVAVGEDVYILPLSSVIECLQPTMEQIKHIGGQNTLVQVRSEYLPLIDLHSVFGLPGRARQPQDAILVIVEAEGRRVALQLDELVGQQQVVIKSLEANFRRIPAFSGATILGDGRVALILDVVELARSASRAAAA